MRIGLRYLRLFIVLGLFARSTLGVVGQSISTPPRVDYHAHLLSPAGAKLLTARTMMEREPRDATALVADLDAAGIQRAVVLSTAYWFDSPVMGTTGGDAAANVTNENVWTLKEVARFPTRLVAFCSVNPLSDAALDEVNRCRMHARVRGLKLHFANSRVDVRNPAHVDKLQRLFGAANSRRLGLVVHLWTGPAYGRIDAEAFLSQVLPSAPDVPVQIAHFAGGGPGYTDAALAVYAEAIAAGDPRTKHLYFDVATVAEGQPPQVLQTFADRIRQVGLARVLYGTDLPRGSTRQSWELFWTSVPLTDAERRQIAANDAPYSR